MPTGICREEVTIWRNRPDGSAAGSSTAPRESHQASPSLVIREKADSGRWSDSPGSHNKEVANMGTGPQAACQSPPPVDGPWPEAGQDAWAFPSQGGRGGQSPSPW